MAFSYQLLFCVGWICINGLIGYAQIDFLLRFTRSCSRKYVSLYVLFSIVLTAAAIAAQLPLLFSLLQIALLFLFSVMLLKIPFWQTIIPATIIYTLCTVMEGFQTVLLRYFSLVLRGPQGGLLLQLLLPTALAVVLLFALRCTAKRYATVGATRVFSCSYVLLVPCALIIGTLRTILGLDSASGPFSHGALIGPAWSSVLYALLWMAGTALVFFILVELFHKVSVLSQKQTDQAILENQISTQRGYIDEARRRNEGYRSFQHDINNHLLIIAGLLQARNYQEAEHYLQKLDRVSTALSAEVSTGNTVLDVLLWEKIRYAKQCGIRVTCEVHIPKQSAIDDMDLCVLFANGLDNAMNACLHPQLADKSIALTARPKHDFLLIHMVNAVADTAPLVYGTGLKNMELTAKKYGGTMCAEKNDRQFSLSILFCHRPAAQRDNPSGAGS